MQRRIGASLLLALGVCRTADEAVDSDPFPAQLVDRWIRVHPNTGVADTLILRADGTVGGSTAAFVSYGIRMTHWQIGDSLMAMPGGLCIGSGWRGTLAVEPAPGSAADTAYFRRPSGLCQGFVLEGDTLALADPDGTVFVRVRAAYDLEALRARFSTTSRSRMPPAAPPPGAAVGEVP